MVGARESARARGWAIVAVALCVSCAHYSPALRASDPQIPSLAYLYGRLYVAARPSALGMDGYQTMGLVIRCADGETYTMRFSKEKGVQAIEIEPSTCALEEIVFTDADGVVKRRAPAPRAWTASHDFAPGRAYYIGDFAGNATWESEWKVVATKFELKWDLTDFDDNYALTTAEMKRTFANLSSLPTEDQTLAPRTRIPGKRRSGAPSASRPGDPMTPERVARIAPYTKRRYATPAECEEACPTGECLPYRGETGPAMTCIVRCKSDRDCPAGLGCNCAQDDGDRCRNIARTPEDAMSGVCLSTERFGERR